MKYRAQIFGGRGGGSGRGGGGWSDSEVGATPAPRERPAVKMDCMI